MKTTNFSVKRVLKYMYDVSVQEKKMLFWQIFWRSLTVAIPLIVPHYIKRIVDIVSEVPVWNEMTVWPVLLEIVTIIFWLWLINNISRRVFEWSIVPFQLRGMKRIYQQCFAKVHAQSYRFFTNSFVGAMVKKVNKLVHGYEKVCDIIAFDLYPVCLWLLIVLWVVWYENVLLWIIFFSFIVIFIIVQYFLYRWKLPYELASHAEDSKNTWLIADTMTNHDNILVFASLWYETKKLNNRLDIWENIVGTAWRKWNTIYAINGVLLMLFEISLLYFSLRFRAWGVISLGTVVLLQLYLFMMADNIVGIGNLFKRIYNVMWEAAEMIEIIDQDIEVKDIVWAKSIEVKHGAIRFDRVWFDYSSSWTSTLENLSLSIKPGEKIALVWPSGAGKSTIVRLLLRYFDIQVGTISIDDQDISQVTQASLRWSLSLVPQDPILFHRTLQENIAYGNPDATLDDVIAASKMARCHDFISNLPDGYETFVGERGIKLSGGERQRVAIARAILENKKILILDEATSSLDSQSEAYIQEAIHEVIQDKTAIVIAHRLSTIKEMDRIIVLDQWQIVEEWTHDELISKTWSLYKKLRELQAGV